MELEEKRRKSFVFNCDWLEILQDFPAEVRLEVYEAAIRYAASGRLSELKPLAKMAFSFIRKEIDYNNSRYDERLSGNNTPGKRGNPNFRKGEANPYYRPKEKENEAAKDNSEIIRDNSEIIRDNSDNSEIIRDNHIYINDNDNVNDNDNENDIEEITPPLQAESCDSASERIDYNGLMELYNSTVGRSLSPIRLMTDARKKRVRTCVRQYGAQSVSEVFRNVQGSPFLLGHGKGGWKATFDWIFTPNNYVKILEGNYNEEPDRKETSGESLRTLARALMQGDVPGTDY